MREQGFAKANGLQFEETQHAGGAAIINAMAAGSVDVGYVGSVPVLSAAANGLIPDVVLPVAGNTETNPEHLGGALLVPLSMKSWKELEGQQVAVNATNSLSAAAIRGRLKLEGVRNFKLVEIDFANMGLAVSGGNVAAATMQEPHLTQSLLRGDGKLLGWVLGGPPFERLVYTVTVFRAKLVRREPRVIKAFLRAQLQAVEWISKHPQDARAILTTRLNLSREVAQKINMLRWPIDQRLDPVLLDGMQRVLLEIDMLKAPIPAKHLYDETLLSEVLREKQR
jgi:NitT/TauT family transport system substrate-binding protein